ncbi:hypothetical protein BDV06DRAFT_62917 [Aspergillus oleicola]
MSYINTLTTKATDLLTKTQSALLSQPATRQRLLLAAIPAAVIASLLPSAYRDYESYIALGPGGPPHNVLGWLVVRLIFNPLGREMFGTGMYERKIESGEGVSFLSDLPARKGERPVMGGIAPPQRQVSQVPTTEVKNKIMEAYNTFLDKNSHIVDRVPSILERYTDAAHVCSNVPLTPVAREMKREICHVHGTSDYSVHVTLSPADCKKVIESGWAQRFPLSGSSIFKKLSLGRMSHIPEEYVFIYAPRDEEEIETVMRILQASVRYVAGVEDVKL